MLTNIKQKHNNSYHIEIVSVKMKIKFNCKMRIEYLDKPLTSDIQTKPNDISLTPINTKVHLSEIPDENQFILVVSLITNKGNKYPAGVLVLQYCQLQKLYKNQKQKIKLSKCLDNQAYMEINIINMIRCDSINDLKNQELNKNQQTYPFMNNIRDLKKQMHNFKDNQNLRQSFAPASEARYSHSKRISHKQPITISRSRSRNNNQSTNSHYQNMRNNSKSPNMNSSRKNILKNSHVRLYSKYLYMEQDVPNHNHNPSQQAYRKLQQKLKHQAQNAQKQFQKRLALQDNQSQLKLQILRMKLKCQQNQRNLSQKIQELKNIELINNQLQLKCQQQQQKIKGLMKGVNNQQIIDTLQMKICQANYQLEQLRSKNMKCTKNYYDKEFMFKKQLQSIRLEVNTLKQSKQKKQAQNRKLTKDNQNLKSILQGKDETIRHLEQDIETLSIHKLADRQRKLQVLEKTKQQMQKKIEQLTKKISNLQTQKIKKSQESQAHKTKISTIEYNYSLLMKTNNNLQQELAEIPKIKQKINTYALQIKQVQNEKKSIQNQFQNFKKNERTVITNLQNKIKKDLETYENTIRNLQANNSSLRNSNKELDNKIQLFLQPQVTNLKRLLDKLQLQIDQYKNNQRNLSKQNRSLQTKISSVNAQIQSLKNKNSGLQNMQRLEIQKLNNEIRNYKQQLQREILKGLSLKQKNKEVNSQNSLLSSKVSHLSQLINKGKKQYEKEIDQKERKINKLEDELERKGILYQEKAEKMKEYMSQIKQYNMNQNQYTQILSKYENDLNNLGKQLQTSQQKLRMKIEESQTRQKSYLTAANKLQEVQQAYKQINNEKKQIQFKKDELQKQNSNLQYQIKSLKEANHHKQILIEKLRNINQEQSKTKTNFKDDINKLQNKAETIKKQHILFKEHLYDVVKRQLGALEGMDINLYITDHRNQNSQQNQSLSQNPNQNQIVNAIKQFSNQTKAIINNLRDQLNLTNKQLQQMHSQLYQTNYELNQKIKEQTQRIHRYQYTQEQLKKNLSQTEKQMNMKNMALSKEAEELKKECLNLQNKIEQLLFNINSLKIEKQTDKQFYENALKENRDTIYNLENSYSNIFEKSTTLELQKNQANLQLKFCQQQINKIKIQGIKKDNKIQILNSELSMKDQMISELKAKNKDLIHKISQIELYLNAQKQMNQSSKRALSQQQNKFVKTKDFINNLIKQKQLILKQQMANKQQCIQLQSKNQSLLNKIEMFQSNNEKLNKEMSNQKQNNKKLILQIKNLQIQIQSQQQKHKKLIDKNKQKQKQINLKAEAYKAKQYSYQTQIQQKNKQIKQKSQQIQLLNNFQTQQRSAMQNQANKNQNELFKIKQQLKYSLYALENANKELKKANKTIQQKITEIQKIKDFQRMLQESKRLMQRNNNQLLQELREKDERMYEMAGEMNSMENNYYEKLMISKRQLQDLEQNMNYKYEAMCEDYETKIDQIEKERDYVNGKVQIMDEQFRKLKEKLSILEYQDNQLRLRSQDRLIRSEQEKNTMISNLRSQMKQIIEEKSILQDKNLKISIELQSLKSSHKNLQTTNSRLQAKNRQVEQKSKLLKQQVLNHQHAIRQKTLQIKQMQQTISNYQWSLQREIKKQFQNINKNLINCLGQAHQKQRKQTVNHLHQVQIKIVRLINTNLSIACK